MDDVRETTVSTESNPTPDEARLMLDRVSQLGVAATAGASWAHIATLLTLGSATSIGTLAMSMTTGSRYLIAMIAMMVWVIVSISFMMFFGRATRLGFKKRWPRYMLAWAIAYVAAIFIVSFSDGENLVGGVIGAALIAAVTITGAVIEARS